jgi:hypothetical protein
MYFAGEVFALKTAFDILVLGAFPEGATLLVFSFLSQLSIDPFASKAFFVFKSKGRTKTAVNATGSNLLGQFVSLIFS